MAEKLAIAVIVFPLRFSDGSKVRYAHCIAVKRSEHFYLDKKCQHGELIKVFYIYI